MTVKETIEKLLKYNPESEIVVRGQEGGFDKVSNVREEDVWDSGRECTWYGRYESSVEVGWPKSNNPPDKKVVVIE